MEADEYLRLRLDDQIVWYDRRSRFNQWCYKGLRIVEILGAAAIPFLSGHLNDNSWHFGIIIGLLGVVIAIITAIVSLFQFQENWVSFRSTCESLRHEKYLFLTRTEPYDVEPSFPLLVQRVESLISKENSMWSQYIKPHKKDKH